MIPLMKDVINSFGGCTDALIWAKEMDVQEGWDVCVEPGWLMLLAFNTQNNFGAVGFDKSLDCTYKLIKPSLVFLDDEYMSKTFEDLYQDNPVDGKTCVEYANDSIKSQYKVFLENPVFTSETVAKFYATQCFLFFAQCVLLKHDIGNSAKAANSAVDYSVMVFAAEKYPDLISKAFRREPSSAKEEVDSFKAQKKIELCGKLRSIIPCPFLEYK
jgi:hypothetical protein